MKKISVLVVAIGIDHKGILANVGFVLGLTVGRLLPENTFGSDVVDKDGSIHKALTNIGHYVREAGQSKLKALRKELSQNTNINIVDYTEDAAPSNYEEYKQNISNHTENEIIYRAIHFYGPEDVLVPKTKNLSMLK